MSARFVVDHPVEIHALVQALFAAKFHAHGDNLELAGSPIVARLCERAMEAMIAAQDAGHLPGNPQETRGRFQSRSPESHIIEAVRRHLAAIAGCGTNWDLWSTSERSEYIRLVFRPYLVDDALVDELAR
ncbi:hypothetical protein [Tuwongella immobilis]|uniref:Uncharacterized protein n=1 Tax=Tuwongella immobilis TaxID=692036 RepID=A0A6C2YSN6_9BACT|nr:hypothetical protein [Tuwongella immobilis]VIP04347.1 unnamed protein product [Tuwongella immobilis]VTS06056.1 unnamed protein product [Tuwongella immobilis]